MTNERINCITLVGVLVKLRHLEKSHSFKPIVKMKPIYLILHSKFSAFHSDVILEFGRFDGEYFDGL